jgi:hypothetical protein
MVKLWDFETAKLNKIKKQFSKYLIAEGGKINKNKYKKFAKIFDPSNSYRKDKVKKAYTELYELITPPKKEKHLIYEVENKFERNVPSASPTSIIGNWGDKSWIHMDQIKKIKKNNIIMPSYHIYQDVKFYNKGIGSRFKNKHISFTNIINEDIFDIRQKTFWNFVPEQEYTEWIIKAFLYEKDETGLINPDGYVIVKSYIVDKIKVQPKPNFHALQTYREDIDGACVYNNVMTFLLNKYEATGNKNIKTKINKLNKNQQLKKGYTLESMQELTNLLNISITIKDLVNGVNHHVSCKDNTNNACNIEMINSRVNHLDLYTANTDIIEIPSDEYLTLQLKTDYYIEKMGVLHTLNGNFKIIETDFQKVYNAWKIKYNYKSLAIPMNSKAYEMIKNYDYNMHRFFNNMEIRNDDYVEWDIKKAYYNYSDKLINKYYHGVPSGGFINVKFEDSMNIDKFYDMLYNGLVGFYNVEILDDNLKDYGFFKGSFHVLFSSIIQLITKYCTIKFLYGSYSRSVHIPYGEDFLRKIPNMGNGLSYYCKANGLFFKNSKSIKYYLKHTCKDEDFYSIIHNDNFNYYIKETTPDYSLLEIEEKNIMPSSHIHIAYAIHAYTKTLILEEMLKIGYNNIFGVKLDSIVLKIEASYDVEKSTHFSEKETKIEKLLKSGNYEKKKYFMNSIKDYNFNYSFLPNREIIINPIVYLNGKGGCGKTYGLCSNDNFDVSNLCYSTTANRLINEQKNKHNKIIGLSIPKLIGEFNGISIPYKENSKIKFLGLDEGTLWTDYQIKKAFKLYSHCIIFIMGDMDIINKKPYQCTMTDKIFNDFEQCQVIQYTKNYRFNEELNNYLDELRIKMNKYKEDTERLFKHVKKTLSNRFFKKEDIIYNNNDIGINCLRDSEEITNYFLKKGAQPKYFVKTSKDGLAKGEQYENKPETKNYEMKLFHTIHSFQGCQLEEDNKIIIYLDRLFDYNLLYTALSRARRIDQIFIIM